MKYFKSHSEFLNEAKLSAIHKAAKKGSYPVTVVVVSNGSVTKQEIVNTPAAVPAVFNELQKQYPNAVISVESNTGETLFSESVELEDVYELAYQKTIKENNFPIIITEVSKSMISDESLNWISEKEAIERYKKEADLLLYSNS